VSKRRVLNCYVGNKAAYFYTHHSIAYNVLTAICGSQTEMKFNEHSLAGAMNALHDHSKNPIKTEVFKISSNS